MAKVTNTFLKSKLNKDLDARLIPNGEYRDAVNVQVSRSEGDSVGSLENVLGNSKDSDFPTGTKCIGHKADEASGMVYLFFTNYTDSSSNNRTYSTTALNYIYEYNIINNTKLLLVQGAFLNFSTTNPIYGINVIEDLLFWTDNRNQPRKINITLARPTLASGIPSYYTKEDQISVAKYNPYLAMDIFEELNITTGSVETTMKDVTSKFYPNGGSVLNNSTIVAGALSIPIVANSIKGEILTATPDNPYAATGSSVAYISRDVATAGQIIKIPGITVSSYTSTNIVVVGTGGLPALNSGTEIIFNANDYYDKDFAGDPDYLKDKFVRFSYRFKFDDGEYSLIAPFTQVAFIPKQDGYFMYVKKADMKEINDQANAYRSSVVSFVENKVNNIKLRIPHPTGLTYGQSISNELKITELDIIYKESDALAIKVIESIDIGDLAIDSVFNFWDYIYKSQKPSRVLPSDEITRVYDKIPVRAFAQESSGNRIIYGNFQNKHTPPATIDYNVFINPKTDYQSKNGSATVNANYNSGTNNFNISNGSGFIGVGSTIVGSNIAPGTLVTQITGAGTFPDPYTNVAFTPVSTGAISNGDTFTFVGTASDNKTTSKVEYPSSSLKQNRNYQVGVVLSDRYGRQSTVILSDKPTTIYSPYNNNSISPDSWPGDSLKLTFNSQVGVSNPDHNTNYPGLYNGDSTNVNYNPLGWYSYKIVVKQTQQEYYNVYLPGIMAAYPEDVNLEIGSTSHIALINDNINKVPRDLTEIGPDQKQFRSSVQLFGRVENTSETITTNNQGKANQQYYPGENTDTSTIISTMRDMFDYPPTTIPSPNPYAQFYDFESNPLISRISTNSKIGQVATHETANTGIQFLAVYETEPVMSLLDIYWETSTSGLISNLNNAISTGVNVGATDIEGFNASGWTEAILLNGVISTEFNLADNVGTDITLSGSDTFVLESVFNDNGINVNQSNPLFEMIAGTTTNLNFNIKVLAEYFDQIFYSNDAAVRNFTFNFKAVINGITTIFTKSAGPNNVPATITVVSGIPNNGETINTNRYNIKASQAIGVFHGVNGSANSSTLATPGGLRVKDLQFSIFNQSIVGDVVDRQSPYFEIFTGVIGGTQNVLSGTLKNTYSTRNVGVKNYTITTQLSDAGSTASHQFFLNLGINVTQVWEYFNFKVLSVLLQRSAIYRMVLIEVSAPANGTAIPNTVGYYVYAGYFQPTSAGSNPSVDPNSFLYGDLNSLVIRAGGGDDFTPISIDRLNAVTTTSAGVWSNWIYSATKQGAIDLWLDSLPAQSNSDLRLGKTYSNPNNGGFTYEVEYN